MSAPIRAGMAAAARCLALDELAALVIRSLHEADIACVLLKGAGLAQRLYPADPSRRRYSDVDLLVAPGTFDRAEQVLTRLGLIDRSSGLREDEMHWYERSWRLPGPQSLTIDLHRSFAGVSDPAAFWHFLSTGAETLKLNGVTARVPDAAGCALVVGLHAAVPGPGRKPLTDLTEALALLPEPVWDAAARLARQTRSTGAFVRGLNRHPTGRTLAVRLQLKAAGTLADDLIAHQVGGLAVSLAKLQDVRGPRAKLRFVVLRLFHSPALMRKNHLIARRGRLGLGAAYALRAGRQAALAPQAVLAVRRARRHFDRQQRRRRTSRLRVLRAVAALDGPDRLTCLWTLHALSRARRQLAAVPLADLNLVRPPTAAPGGSFTVDRVLARRGASCIEAAVVMQRWLAGQGEARDLLIGVSAPGESFRAHAWLLERMDEHDRIDDSSDTDLTEIYRRPTPAAWLANRPRVGLG